MGESLVHWEKKSSQFRFFSIVKDSKMPTRGSGLSFWLGIDAWISTFSFIPATAQKGARQLVQLHICDGEQHS